MTTSIRRADSVLVREIDGEVVILDTQSGRIHQLNRTASFIWRMCDEATTPQDIAAALAREFDVDEATALEDVQKTLSLLRTLKLLVPA